MISTNGSPGRRRSRLRRRRRRASRGRRPRSVAPRRGRSRGSRRDEDGRPGPRPSRITRSAASSVAGKWRSASFVTAWRTLSSMEPGISPPWMWASGMFMYDAAIAVAIVSKRSATRDDDVGLQQLEHRRQLEQRRGRSTSPWSTGVSPSMMKRIVASGSKPSVAGSRRRRCRSARARARRPATSWSSSSGCSWIAFSSVLIRA